MSVEDSLETVPKKRVPRKRAAPRKAVAAEGEVATSRRVTTPRRRTTSTPSVEREEPRVVDETTRPSRKSPTPLSGTAARLQQQRRQQMVISGILLTGILASAGIGFSDSGTVDIEQRIESRNERIRNNTPTEQDLAGGVETVVAASANSARPVEADGGMRGRGTGGGVQQRAAAAAAAEAKTATTTVNVSDGVTDESASTTSTAAATSTPPTEAYESLTEPSDTSDTDSLPAQSPE